MEPAFEKAEFRVGRSAVECISRPECAGRSLTEPA